MSALPIVPWFTLDEFLEREADSKFRHEFRRGHIVMMAGGVYAHSVVAANLLGELRNALRGRKCQVHGPDLLIHIDRADAACYPDVMAICGKPSFPVPRKKNIVDNPVLIAEVLSPSTEDYCRREKFEIYKQIPTLREYLLAAPDQPRIERFTRQPDGTWIRAEFLGESASLILEGLEISIPLAEIYRGVEPDED